MGRSYIPYFKRLRGQGRCLFEGSVHAEHGTIFIPVWSQLRMSSGGISSMVTVAIYHVRKVFCSSKIKVCLSFFVFHSNGLSLDIFHDSVVNGPIVE